MTTTESNKIAFAQTLVLCKVADSVLSLTPCSHMISAGAKVDEIPESR